MKKYLFILFALMLAFTACKNSSPKEKLLKTELVIPPPVVQEKEVMADEKLYAPAAIEVAEPVGNQIMANKSAGGADASLIKKENTADTEKKIIKEGEIRFETSNVVETRRQIISSLKHLGGYADDDSEDTNGDAGSKEYTLSIRIPAKNFDAFLGTVSSTATKIDSRNIRIKDVTSQFIDTKARLDNKLQLEKRYLNLLNRAGKCATCWILKKN